MAKKPAAAPAPKPEFKEVAAAGDRDHFGAWLGELVGTPDPVLASLGGDLAHYRRLMSDPKVKSVWQQRQRAVLAADWEVEPGGDSPRDKAAAEDLQEQLDGIAFDAACAKMLHAQFYGYAVGELMYARDGQRIVLTDIRVRRQERFVWTRDLELKLLRAAGNPLGDPVPPAKFWVVKAEGDNDDDPHGLGLAHWLYWPVWFKRNGAKFWAVALEKFGMPTAVGIHPQGATDPEIAKLLASLRAIHGSSAVAFPDGFEAKFLESLKTSGGSHEAFMRYWDEEIIQVLLSQTMTTNNGSSRSQAEVHAEVRDDVVKGDSDLTCESFNTGPARWLTAWNHPGAAVPRVWRRLDAEEDLSQRAAREKIIAETSGLRPTAKHVVEVYGGEWEVAPAAAPAQPPFVPAGPGRNDPAFAEAAERDATDDLVDQMLTVTAPALEAVVETIRQTVDEAPTLEIAIDRLAALFPGKTPGDLEEVLASAMMASHLGGMADG